MLKNFILIFFVILFVGCVYQKSTMDSWLGSKESDLLGKWGAPNAKMDTREGDRVLTWETPWGRDHNLCRKSFTIDESGIITRYAYSGCSAYFGSGTSD